jgi:pimeloyl-ACP methyl ester carboxylesterase
MTLDSFMFLPTPVESYLNPADMDSAWMVRFVIPCSLYQEVELLSSGGNRIYGFLVQPDGQHPVENNITVLYCHGNADNINRFWGRVERLWEVGFRVFIFDYQGYGRSEGEPSGEACFADGRAALRYLRGRPEVDTARIIYYGYSMGSFIATHLAADSLAPAALMLEAAPASVTALVREGTLLEVPGSFLADLDFDNERRIPLVGAPALLLHGRDDTYLLPERHPRRIISAARGFTALDTVWVAVAGHDNVPETMGEEYGQVLSEFVGRVLP